MRLHHIGYAVENLDAAEAGFAALGYCRRGDATDDPHRSVRILFMEGKSGDIIELIQPLNEQSPVTARLMVQKGISHPYHLCFAVESIEAAIEELEAKGFMRISDNSPAPAIESRNVCFLLSKTAGLIELVEG